MEPMGRGGVLPTFPKITGEGPPGESEGWSLDPGRHRGVAYTYKSAGEAVAVAVAAHQLLGFYEGLQWRGR